METDFLTKVVAENNFFNAMRHHFYLHHHTLKSGERQIMLNVTINKERLRIPTGFFIEDRLWDNSRRRVKDSKNKLNISLDNIVSKITEIQTFFFISKKTLTPEVFMREFFNKTPSYDFIGFMESSIEKESHIDSTKRSLIGIASKLRKYKSQIPFNEVTLEFFHTYRGYLKKIGNSQSTINNNIKKIKQYLRLAQKQGIIISIDLDNIYVGSTSGKGRVNLNFNEVEILKNFYFENSLSEGVRLSLGYFLFSCFTSLRISDIQQLSREQILGDSISFKSIKTKELMNITLNKTAKEIINFCPELFKVHIARQNINDYLKDIRKILGINKKITMHVGRHTFATNFLRKGGKVEELQKILGHKKIEYTMIYVHIVEAEANKSIFLLDD